MSLNLTFRMVEFTICFFLCVVCLPSAFCPNAFVCICYNTFRRDVAGL